MDDNAKPVVVIHAIAGHGKSTLLHQLIEYIGDNELVVLLKVRPEHNDISRFFNDFQQALENGLGVKVAPAKRISTTKSKGVGFTDYLLSKLSLGNRKINVIFDDFHCLSNQVILTIITDLLDRSLKGVRFIFSCREIPDISLERLLISGQVLLLGAEELRFSRQEITSFVNHWSEAVFSDDDVNFFEQWTQGWPAGLQLLKLVLKDKGSLGNIKKNKDVELPLWTNYLADNVLAVLPSDTQEFLLKTSILKTMSADLCEAVTGYSNCQSMLEKIERSGVFLQAIDKSYQWFSYHSIFTNFLKNQLHTQLPDTEDIVHRKALQWYRERGLHEESIYHAEAIHDFNIMADILDEWSAELIIKAHLETVEFWYDRLPESAIELRPLLAVRVSWALIFLRRFNKLDVLLAILDRQKEQGMWQDNTSIEIIRAVAALMNDDIIRCEEIIKVINVDQYSVDDFRSFELSAVANMQALFSLFDGRFDDARELLAISHAYSTNVSAVFSDSYSCGVNGFRLLAQGCATEAFAELEAEAATKDFYLAGVFAASALISCHAWVLYERDEIQQAKEELEGSLEAILGACLLDWAVMAFVALGRVYFLSNDLKRQELLYKKAEMIGYSRSWKRLIRVVQSERIRSALLSGDLSLAKSLNSRINRTNDSRWPTTYTGFYGDTESDKIRDIRLGFYCNEPSAYGCVVEEIVQARLSGRRRRLLTLLILKAKYENHKGEINTALNDIKDAIALAAPEGYVRCFLDEGKDVAQLLVKLYIEINNHSQNYNKKIDLTFLDRLVSVAGLTHDIIQVPKRDVTIFNESMTNREKQILVLVAKGSSNKEIAKEVFLSENTVKFHLKNIFSKLGVSNRTQAISVAHDSNII